MTEAPRHEPLAVEPWPTELPLLVGVILAAAGLWLALALSIIGIVYAAMLAAFFFLTHIGFIAYVRGSAVRLGPEQFPELYLRVEELSARAGLREPPQAYLMQAGGSLNALATKLFRSRMIVLFSDLLEACGTHAAARDFIIGHEIGHIRAGHLNWIWLVLPGMFVPFLGGAYSRARERTCDRYGAALCGDRGGALRGLSILAAGGERGPNVNLQAWVGQRADLDTGWMTLATWLAGYPPLCERVALLEPSLGPVRARVRGPLRALGILVVAALVPTSIAAVGIASFLPAFRKAMDEAAALETQGSRVWSDLDELGRLALEVSTKTGQLPGDDLELYKAWERERPGLPAPTDMHDGKRYGYRVDDDGSFVVWSAGPDAESGTNDDRARRWNP